MEERMNQWGKDSRLGGGVQTGIEATKFEGKIGGETKLTSTNMTLAASLSEKNF